MFRTRTIAVLVAWTIVGVALKSSARDIPAELPRPDNAPVDTARPVKVYILSGQSNMVGFGLRDGSGPVYNGVYLAADPNLAPGLMRVNRFSYIARHHGVYQAPDAGADRGARVAIYAGAYDPDADYAAKKPARETTVALGTITENLPAIEGPHTLMVKAFVDVPEPGLYRIHAGFEQSSHCIATLNGKEVYRKEVGGKAVMTDVELKEGPRYPLTITYLEGGSAALWLERADIRGRGHLRGLIKDEKKWLCMVDEKGNWTRRNDVYFQEARFARNGSGSSLSPTSGYKGRHIGPELGFGYVMGTFHDEQVLLIKVAMGNRSLKLDYRPPSSGVTGATDRGKTEGWEYRLMVEGVRRTLDNIASVVPGYNGQGYEIAGFAWWQGHKDGGQSQAQYEKNLVNLIEDLRAEFKTPRMKAVVATVGFQGFDMGKKYQEIHGAQMAVGDPEKHPEFAGTVASVDTRPFWRPRAVSPSGADYHYNHNAETYLLTGDAMGRAMVRLHGGRAEDRDATPAKVHVPAVPENVARPTEAQREASRIVMKPMVLERMLPVMLEQNKWIRDEMVKNLRNKKSRRPTSQPYWDYIDMVNDFCRVAGITDYEWKPCGPDMRNAVWDYHSFDPKETRDRSRRGRYRDVTFPAGMAKWFMPEFDAKAAGWKSGNSPFGQMDGRLAAVHPSCKADVCGCGAAPKTLWEKEVLLMRRSFAVPPLKKGHRYRMLVGGGSHGYESEGFAVYVNGSKMIEATQSAGKRQGGRPRGGPVPVEFLDEFAREKVTIAVISFLNYRGRGEEARPVRGNISVWMEEMKLPDIVLDLVDADNR